MNKLSPRCDLERSGSVRANNINTLARAANVHQVFTPLMTYPSTPSRFAAVAVVFNDATSLP